MKNNPIVSVVIPLFNVENYIEECVNSVLAQTWQNFEIICVDDGCTDSTLDKLAQFNDPRIRVIRQTNKGLAAARNTGINAALGLYVALLDADDFWAPRKLALHLAHLQAHPEVGVSYCASLFVDDASQLLGIGQFPKLSGIKPQDIFCRNPVGNGSAAVIRRRVLADIGVVKQIQPRWAIEYFDENLRQSEDIECWLRIALNTPWQFAGIGEALTYYRVNTQGLSANIEKQQQSWLSAVRRNLPGHEAFFARWLSLAQAYQQRYLARRAVQLGSGRQALGLIHQALWHNWRILWQEPARTLLTYACCWLSILPNTVFSTLRHGGLWCLGKLHTA